jgi:hypothetical protein
MSRNLPPGTTPTDIDRHFGGSTHEHEWEPVGREYPVLEDMAALFHERCVWAGVVNTHTDYQRDETYYEYGRECDETRWRRFDLVYVAKLSEKGQQDARWDRDDINQLEKQDVETFEAILDTIISIEQASFDGTEIVEIDPDPQQGQVVIRHEDHELGYGPGVADNE